MFLLFCRLICDLSITLLPIFTCSLFSSCWGYLKTSPCEHQLMRFDSGDAEGSDPVGRAACRVDRSDLLTLRKLFVVGVM